MGPTLVKAAAAGGGGRRPAFTRVGPIDDNRGPSLRQPPAWPFARSCARKGKAGERPSASVEAPWGMRFSCGFSTGSRVTMTFGAAKAIMGSARLGFEGNYTAGAKIIAPQPCIRWVLQPEP